MDGSNHTVLHNTSLNKPYALTIDYDTQTLLNRLESSSTDGSNRMILNSNLRDPYAMTFFDGVIYWTDWSYNGIYSTLSDSPSNINSGLLLNADPFGILVYDEVVQFEGANLLLYLFSYICTG